ncbi:unnamed protein product [Arabis nemorensis]|uniref:Transmembrane protein n=1 Tax=Arabis nemorensis TaxID=586526 RepID=A0A565B5R1_9BRAS|nr:unnamed protein product [Arabis nemorensis]
MVVVRCGSGLWWWFVMKFDAHLYTGGALDLYSRKPLLCSDRSPSGSGYACRIGGSLMLLVVSLRPSRSVFFAFLFEKACVVVCRWCCVSHKMVGFGSCSDGDCGLVVAAFITIGLLFLLADLVCCGPRNRPGVCCAVLSSDL